LRKCGAATTLSGTKQPTCEKCGRLAAQSVAWPTVAVDQTTGKSTGKGCVIRKRRPSCPTEGGRNRLLQSKENKFYATVRHNGHTRMTPPRRLFIQLPACIACSCIPRVSASSISQLGGAHCAAPPHIICFPSQANEIFPCALVLLCLFCSLYWGRSVFGNAQ
jgi:hypothetical protein